MTRIRKRKINKKLAELLAKKEIYEVNFEYNYDGFTLRSMMILKIDINSEEVKEIGKVLDSCFRMGINARPN